MQASWSQWGAQAAAGVAANATSYSMPPPTPAASTATTATAAATQATPGVNAFSMGAYGLYNAQAAAMTPAMNPAVAGAGVAAAGYSPQQWAMAQQQNWQQWEQWQQQYAQWQQQYGEKYQAHMNAAAAMGMPTAAVPTPGAVAPKPPLPSGEPQQPPLPNTAPVQPPAPQYDSGPPKGSSSFGSYAGKSQVDDSSKRSFDGKEDKDSKDDSKKAKLDKSEDSKAGSKKETLEELAEAEKAFDLQFRNWENQFLRWKEQNINHPDKSQYKEYEAKWESWREQLLERREQMKKKREVKEAQIKAAEQAAALEASAKEAKKEAASASMSMMTQMSAAAAAAAAAANVNMMKPGAATAMNQAAMFQLNPALNPAAAAMAGFQHAYGAYGAYGGFPGMTVPPPVVPTAAGATAQMAQFPGMTAAAVNPETNSAPLDFLKPAGKGIPGLDLVGDSDDSKTGTDPNKNSHERNDYSGRDLNKPLTTSDDKPFQFPPPVGQMPPFMAQNYQQKTDLSQQVGVPPPFMPNAAGALTQPPPNMFSGPPPDGFGYPQGMGANKMYSTDGPPPNMAPNSMFGLANQQQMFGMQNSMYPGAQSANSYDQSDMQGTKAFSADKSNDHSNSYNAGGPDNFRSQGKSGALLPTPRPGFNDRFSGGNNFSQGKAQDSGNYDDNDYDGPNDQPYGRKSYEDSDYSDSYNKFKGASSFDGKGKPPSLMDSYNATKGPQGSRDGDFNQRRSRFDDAPSFDNKSAPPAAAGGNLNSAGSLLRPGYLDRQDNLDRLRSSAGGTNSSSVGGLLAKPAKDGLDQFGFSSDSPEDEYGRGRGRFDEDFDQFDDPNSRDPFSDSRDAKRFDEPAGRGRFNEPAGRGRFDAPTGRGRFDEPAGRGRFDESRGRSRFDDPAGRGRFDEPAGRGRFDGPAGRGRFDEPAGRGRFDEQAGQGRFDDSRGRGGRFNDSRGRGRFDGPDRGFDDRNKFDADNKFDDKSFGSQRPPYRDENEPPTKPPGDREKWGRPPGPSPLDRFEPPPLARPPRPEVDFLRPSKVIDYNHKRIEPEFFEPVTITDYGHGIHVYSGRTSAYDRGIRRSELIDDKRQRHSRSPPRRLSPRRSPPRRMSPSRRNSPRRSPPRRSSHHRSPSRENRSPNRRNSPISDKGSSKKIENKEPEKDSKKIPESVAGQNKPSEQESASGTSKPQSTPAVLTAVSISDILDPPGRSTRPEKIVFILRGPPGSGKSYVAKLIKDKEVENGGSAPRILSLDDYYVTEVEKEEIDPETKKKVTTKKMEYVYEAGMDSHYRLSLIKAFRKTLADGFFPFIIVDGVFDKVGHYGEIIGASKGKGFKPYVCEMELDLAECLKHNIHNRSEADIKNIISRWEKTPSSQTTLDVRPLLQSDSITEVNMEDITDEPESSNEEKKEENKSDESKKEGEIEEDDIRANLFTSKWELMEFNDEKKDQLDGLRKKRAPASSIQAWLQSNSTSAEDEFQSTEGRIQQSVPGKKRVRWADMEERHAVEKMRNLGFVVGQTDWSRMMDPSQGESKLTQIKYI